MHWQLLKTSLYSCRNWNSWWKKKSTRTSLTFLLACNVSDVSGKEDLWSIKRDFQIFIRCHICLAEQKHFPYSSCAERRALSHTKQIFSSLSRSEKNTAAEDNIKIFSIHPVLPVLSWFPFIGRHPCVALYTIFQPEPMHLFSLEISEMLKKCLVDILGDSRKTSSAVRIAQRQNRTDNKIKESWLVYWRDF